MSEDGPSGPRWRRVGLLGLALAVAVAYAPSLGGDFLFDDVPLLQGYECWRGLDRVPDMLGLGDPNPCTYRPVRYVTFALDYSVASALGEPLSPVVYHVSNVLWHLLAVALVFALLRRWTTPTVALLLTALWALHSVHTDAVAYISGRRDVVSTLLYVASALQFLPRQGGGGLTREPKRLALGAGLFVLAALTKEMAVTLPAVLVWGAVVGAGATAGRLREHLARRWPVYVLLLGGAAAFVVWRGVLASHSAMQGQWWGGSATSNFATVFALYGRYLQLVVWPAPLIGDYFPVTISIATDFGDPRTLLGLGLYVMLVGVMLVALRRGWRATAFGLGWFLVTMLPVSHVLPHHELFAEHYLYLPLIGLFLAAAPLLERGLAGGANRRAAALMVLVGLAFALGVRTGVRAAEYRSERAFYEAAVAAAPDNGRATHYLGALDVESGRCAEAVVLFERSARVIPASSRLGRDGLAARLRCADELGRRDQLGPLLERLLAAHPDDRYGLAMRARQALEAGRPQDALADLERATAGPGRADPQAVTLLASLYAELGRNAEALSLLEGYTVVQPDLCEQRVRALLGLGVARYAEAFGVVDECVRQFPEAWRLLELRAGLNLARGRRDLMEADLAQMRALGAPAEAMERVRGMGAPSP